MKSGLIPAPGMWPSPVPGFEIPIEEGFSYLGSPLVPGFGAWFHNFLSPTFCE